MAPQIIRTESGEELIVLTRREYDSLLAQAGDEEAEDRMSIRIVDEVNKRIETGEETFVVAGPDGRPPRP